MLSLTGSLSHTSHIKDDSLNKHYEVAAIDKYYRTYSFAFALVGREVLGFS